MSIEKNIERIADALELIAKGAGSVANAAPGAVPAAKAVTAKPAAVVKTKPVAVAEPAAEEVEAEGETIGKEQLANIIVALIQANLRTEAVKLLSSYGAKAVSEVKEADYAALHAKGSAILATA